MKVKTHSGVKDHSMCMHSRKPLLRVCQKIALSHNVLGKCHKLYSSNSSNITCSFLLKSVVISPLSAKLNTLFTTVKLQRSQMKLKSLKMPLFNPQIYPLHRLRSSHEQWEGSSFPVEQSSNLQHCRRRWN